MELWRKHLARSITDPGQLPGMETASADKLRDLVRRYPMRITPHYLSLVREVDDPIWRQCVPDLRESVENGLIDDPLDEEGLSPVPGLIHRYPDRVVWLVSSDCAMYCRFCMRKRQVGCSDSPSLTGRWDDALAYIAATPAIRDVILSGGDPLLLDDDTLDWILSRLRAIPHVEIIRIGTRVPVTLPMRITQRLCRILKRYHPLYVNTHFNHPAEIVPASARACALLADAGIPLGNQTVLLRGVNDMPEVMKTLMQQLLAIRVRPYYIHQLDLVRGTGHFRCSLECGITILEGLRGHTSGLATPYYVVDLPGGKGKVPLLPDCVRKENGRVRIRTYRGEWVEYAG
jgi:lysine 2,3-aminomutase